MSETGVFGPAVPLLRNIQDAGQRGLPEKWVLGSISPTGQGKAIPQHPNHL